MAGTDVPAAVCTFDVRRHGVPQKGETKLKLVVIDGQGGGFGRAIIEALRAKGYTGEVLAVGTNALATSAMLKAGASAGATGENAAAVNAARAQVIAGPLGLVMANSMLGECTPAMAAAIAQSPAVKVLVPAAKCGVQVAGLAPKPLGELIDDAAQKILALLEQQDG